MEGRLTLHGSMKAALLRKGIGQSNLPERAWRISPGLKSGRPPGTSPPVSGQLHKRVAPRALCIKIVHNAE